MQLGNRRTAMDYTHLSVIVPAHNEEAAIGAVLEDLMAHLPGCQIIVVDDCSTDRTAERARAYGQVRVLSLPYNHGYGGALRRGILAADGDWIAWFDADSEHRAEDLRDMVATLGDQKLAAVIGMRRSSVSRSRLYGKLLIRLLAVALGLGYVRDFNCGLRVFQRDVILRFFLLLPTGYSASTTSTFLVIRSRLPFRFHPIELRPRIGQSKVQLKDGFRTLVTIVRVASLLQPLRLFGTLALTMGGVGGIYSLVVMLLNNQGIPQLGTLLMVSAVLTAGIAILADQLSLFRIQHSTAVGLARLERAAAQKEDIDG